MIQVSQTNADFITIAIHLIKGYVSKARGDTYRDVAPVRGDVR